MNSNIDLTKILKDCPMGWRFYSSVYGDVEFIEIYREPVLCNPSPREDVWLGSVIHDCEYPIRFWSTNGSEHSVSSRGEMIKCCGECTLFPSHDQRDWTKFTAPWYKKEQFNKKMVKPKFKVGDRIRHKETNKDDVYEIRKVYDDSYGIAGFNWMILMKYQDQYELVSNKFDPKTLHPFDKVLVSDEHYTRWRCSFFSHIVNKLNYKYFTTDSCYKLCIPYNDETKHLVGTTKEAPEYYRYWEE